MKCKMSKYERNALKEIRAWKTPSDGWLHKAWELVSWPIEKGAGLALSTPYIGEAVTKSVAGIIGLVNDGAGYSVRTASIYREFRKAGHEVSSFQDIQTLDLEDVDRVIGYLAAKYKGLAMVSGATAGTIGTLVPGPGTAAAIAGDISALVSMNLRAIAEYATYCGFNIKNQQERLFAFDILRMAADPSSAGKQAAMAELGKVAHQVAQKKTWEVLQKSVFVQAIQRIAQSLGVNLTKAKLAQIIPLAGIVVGAGYDAYFTNSVCDAAYYLYRERFLAEKYGEDVIIDVPEPEEEGNP